MATSKSIVSICIDDFTLEVQRLQNVISSTFFYCRCGLETWIMTPGDVDWRPGQCLLVSKPSWIDDELPGNDGAFWAPTLLNSTFMYYSVASMDRDAQCIDNSL